MKVRNEWVASTTIELSESEASELASLLDWAGRDTRGGAITVSEMRLAALLSSLLMGDGDEDA